MRPFSPLRANGTIGRSLTTAPTAISEAPGRRTRRSGRADGLFRFVLRRLVALLVLLLGITAVTFLLTQLVPSNAVATGLGEQAAADPAAVAAFEHHYGLDVRRCVCRRRSGRSRRAPGPRPTATCARLRRARAGRQLRSHALSIRERVGRPRRS